MCSGEEVVRGPFLLKAGFTRTVLFPAWNCTLPIILLLPLCFPCTHFKCCCKMEMEEAVRGSMSGNRCSVCAELSWNRDQSWNWSPAQTQRGSAQTSPAGGQVEVVSCDTNEPFRSHHKAPPFVDKQNPWLKSSSFPAKKRS